MKQNEILMIGGVAILGIAAFTMMNNRNSQSQQMQQQMMLQQMQMMQQQRQPVQQVNTNTGGSSAPKERGIDKAGKIVDTASNAWGVISDVIGVFRGTPQGVKPLI